VIDAMLRRPERASALLSAIEAGTIGRADLSASQVEFLRKRGDRTLQQRAAQVLGPIPAGKRAEVVKAFTPALALKGEAERGQRVYLERCASCHRLAGQGHALGPDLETVRANGREQLLAHILDPNREVMPKYVSYFAETNDGESVTGLVANESDSTIVLRQPNDAQTVLSRQNLVSFRSLGQSMMPEGLEEGLSAQDLADLMEYVLTARAGP
jgi:putative heme-binding domain-containing protein